MSYDPTEWKTGDTITAEKMNKLEQGVANEQVGPAGPAGKDGEDGAPGADGADGAAAGFGTCTATVDNNTGVPSVEVQTSGPDTAKVFAFTFKNLKGAKGDKGDTGDTGPKGDPGEQGEAGIGLTGSASAIESIATPESADAATIANKVNEIITQLKARGVCS